MCGPDRLSVFLSGDARCRDPDKMSGPAAGRDDFAIKVVTLDAVSAADVRQDQAVQLVRGEFGHLHTAFYLAKPTPAKKCLRGLAD